MATTWSPAPRERVTLRLEPAGQGVSVRITTRSVTAARETFWHRFIHTPTIWASTLAGLALFALVSTAFATGTIRPAPPPARAPRLGHPTPTPDARPALSIGGFVLQPPARRARVPAPSVDISDAPAGEQTSDAVEPAIPQQALAAEQPPPAPGCTNFLGLGCGRRPALSERVAPAEPAPAPAATQPELAAPSVVPVPSPAAYGPGPQPGSNLDTALRVASLANDRFNRALGAPRELPAQPGSDDR